MDTNTLQAFVAVAESGSFSAAAKQIFLTQPAVSKRVAALEQELDARLFQRMGRRVLLTEAGKVLLPKAKHILLEIEESKQVIHDLSNEVGGTLQLAISHHVGLHRLPAILYQYGRQYPKVVLDLHFMGSEAGCEGVASGNIELAVVTLPQNSHPKLHAKEIWHDPLMLMVRKDHPLVSEKKDISALQYYPAILPEKGTITRQIIEDALEPFQILFHTVAETNYLETIRVLVSVGLGWSVLPLSMKNDDLSIIDIEELKFMRNLGVVVHKNRTLSNAAMEFCTMLVGDR